MGVHDTVPASLSKCVDTVGSLFAPLDSMTFGVKHENMCPMEKGRRVFLSLGVGPLRALGIPGPAFMRGLLTEKFNYQKLYNEDCRAASRHDRPVSPSFTQGSANF